MNVWYKFSRPGHQRATQSWSSAKITQSTSSSKNLWYETFKYFVVCVGFSHGFVTCCYPQISRIIHLNVLFYLCYSCVMQLFFPEHMISNSADVTKELTSSELVQVGIWNNEGWLFLIMSFNSWNHDDLTLFSPCRVW